MFITEFVEDLIGMAAREYLRRVALGVLLPSFCGDRYCTCHTLGAATRVSLEYGALRGES